MKHATQSAPQPTPEQIAAGRQSLREKDLAFYNGNNFRFFGVNLATIDSMMRYSRFDQGYMPKPIVERFAKFRSAMRGMMEVFNELGWDKQARDAQFEKNIDIMDIQVALQNYLLICSDEQFQEVAGFIHDKLKDLADETEGVEEISPNEE